MIARFNCEITEHEDPVPVLTFQRTILNYGPQEIITRHAAIPALAFGVFSCGVSLKSTALPAIPWQHGVIALVGGPLTVHEACVIVNDRRALGIDTDFQYLAAIIALATGAPYAAAAAIAGLPQATFAIYVDRALRGGGYFSNEVAALYRFRNNPVVPNMVFLALPGGGFAPTTCVVLHLHLTTRVSKNLKEFSFNANLVPAGVGGAPYLSMKDIVNNQFVGAGFQVPSSLTIVSADYLQPF